MKKLIVGSILLASLGFFVATATADAATTPVSEKQYTAMLDAKVAHCKAKTRYQDSRMEAMRKTARLAKLKARFLETNRQALVDEMLTAGLEATSAKTEHFLNARFESYQEALRQHYTAYLDTRIANCQAKVSYGQSKFSSMRRLAAISALKAQLLETHQDQLVDQMVGSQLGTRTAKLDHFTNGQFKEFVHPQLLADLAGR